MRFGFVTCVQLGLSCMEAIYRSGGSLKLAITLPNNLSKKKSGRVYIDNFCSKHQIPLVKSSKINHPNIIKKIKETNIDWLFIIGWSQVACKDILNSTKKGVIGMHPTLLPEGRGRASIPWAILNKLDKTGVTMFKMDIGIDSGPIISQIKIPLGKNITSTKLYKKVQDAHFALMKKMTKKILKGKIKLVSQDHAKATYWPKRSPVDGQINLKGSVYEAERLVRATTYPYPGAFYYLNGIKKTIWSSKVVKVLNNKHKKSYLKFKDGFLVILK